MKKNKSKIIMTVISFSLIGLAFGQEKWNEYRGRRGKALEYREVAEYELEKDTREIKFSHKGRTSIDFAKVVVSKKELSDDRRRDDEVKFFQEDNLIHKIKLGTKSRVTRISDQGKYVIISTVLKQSVYKGPDGLSQYELINFNGKRVWTKTQIRNWDALENIYFISDFDGSVVELEPYKVQLIFYTPQGDTINSFNVFKTAHWSTDGRELICKYTLDGNYFVAGVSDKRSEIFPTKSGIILFDKQGNELWRLNTEGSSTYRLHVSPDSRFIMTYHRNDFNREEEKHIMYLIDIQGRIIKQYDKMIAGVLFSSDGEYVALNTGRIVKLISTEDGETLATYGLSLYDTRREGNKIIVNVGHTRIRGIDISSEKKLIAILQAKEKIIEEKVDGGGIRYKSHQENAEITIYHFNGVPAWKKVFTDEKFEGYRLSIHISKDGKEVMAKLGRKIKKYRLVQ